MALRKIDGSLGPVLPRPAPPTSSEKRWADEVLDNLLRLCPSEHALGLRFNVEGKRYPVLYHQVRIAYEERGPEFTNTWALRSKIHETDDMVVVWLERRGL